MHPPTFCLQGLNGRLPFVARIKENLTFALSLVFVQFCKQKFAILRFADVICKKLSAVPCEMCLIFANRALYTAFCKLLFAKSML